MGRRKTFNEFCDDVYKLHNGEYSVVSLEYINCSTNVTIRHNTCGREYPIRPDNFLGGRKCINCTKKVMVKPKDEFMELFLERAGNEYVLLSTEYKGLRHKIKLRHTYCGGEFEIAAKNFIYDKSGCRICCKNIKRSHEEFCDIAKDFGYELLDEYVNSYTKVNVRHEECGEVFNIIPTLLVKKDRRCVCNRDSESIGEKTVKHVLNELCVTYVPQYTFKKCRNIHVLRFDFAVIVDGKVKLLIEYDGKQHYEVIDFFGGVEGYLGRIKHDRIKSDYCKENHIPLLRVRYDQNNVEKFVRGAVLNVLKTHDI